VVILGKTVGGVFPHSTLLLLTLRSIIVLFEFSLYNVLFARYRPSAPEKYNVSHEIECSNLESVVFELPFFAVALYIYMALLLKSN